MILNSDAFDNVKIFSCGKHTVKTTAKDKASSFLRLLSGDMFCNFIGIVKVSAVKENHKSFF